MNPDAVTEILVNQAQMGRDIRELKQVVTDGVLPEQKKTNGRVSALEVENEVKEALRQEREKILKDHRRKWEFARPAAAGLICGVFLLFGQHLIH